MERFCPLEVTFFARIRLLIRSSVIQLEKRRPRLATRRTPPTFPITQDWLFLEARTLKASILQIDSTLSDRHWWKTRSTGKALAILRCRRLAWTTLFIATTAASQV